jgi:tetratricopeptide (TPR) repeat protein
MMRRALLLVPLLAATAASASVENDLAFAKALLDRGYLDLAERELRPLLAEKADLAPVQGLEARLAMARLLIRRGSSLRERGRIDPAIRALDEARSLLERADVAAADWGESTARYWIGVTLYESGVTLPPGDRRKKRTLEKAIDHWESFIWDYDGSIGGLYGYFYMGLVRAELGDTVDAMEFFTTAISVPGPDLRELDRRLVRLVLEKMLRLAEKLRPVGRARTTLSAAETFLKLGDHERARRLADDATKLAAALPGEWGQRLRVRAARILETIEKHRASD